MSHIIKIISELFAVRNIHRHLVCPSSKQYILDLFSEPKTTYSFMDERTVGYIATGMCAEAGEPVVIWCANDGSFRNLAPALTEAYYRKLPIFVVAMDSGHSIDQTVNPEDILRYKYTISPVVTETSFNQIISEAIDCLYKTTTGPVLLEVSDNVTIKADSDKKYDSNVVGNEMQQLLTNMSEKVVLHLGNDFSEKEGKCREGKVSQLIGASLVNPNQLFVGIFSNDEIARDINMLGNRHVANNIIVININAKQEEMGLFDFAKRMSWDCKRMALQSFEKDASGLSIKEQPQYFEITK